MSENTIVYVCQTCGELVPLGCCTCGPRQKLQAVGAPTLGGRMYIRKVEMFEIRSDDNEMIHWRGTGKELTALLGDSDWAENHTVVFALLGQRVAILSAQRAGTKGAR